MRKKTFHLLAALLMMLTAMLTSCEKFVLDDSNAQARNADGNVTIRIEQVQNTKIRGALSRADSEKDLNEICSRLSFVVFDGDQKIFSKNQTSADADFGTCYLNLDEGEYRLVVIAHSGLGNCTISSPEKIKFYNNKLTDTFYSYSKLKVTEDGLEAHIHLLRGVAAFNLHIADDEIPEAIKGIKFYYLGGSSTLNAITGCGCVNSRQTESFKIADNQRDFTVYTFPHQEKKDLNMTISTLDFDSQVLKEYTLQNIKIRQNAITKASISLKDGAIKDEGSKEQDDKGDIGFTVDDEWETDTIVYF